MKIYRNGEYMEVDTPAEPIVDLPEAQTVPVDAQEALQMCAAEIASTDTNSIAKIRAAFQRFLDATGG